MSEDQYKNFQIVQQPQLQNLCQYIDEKNMQYIRKPQDIYKQRFYSIIDIITFLGMDRHFDLSDTNFMKKFNQQKEQLIKENEDQNITQIYKVEYKKFTYIIFDYQINKITPETFKQILDSDEEIFAIVVSEESLINKQKYRQLYLQYKRIIFLQYNWLYQRYYTDLEQNFVFPVVKIFNLEQLQKEYNIQPQETTQIKIIDKYAQITNLQPEEVLLITSFNSMVYNTNFRRLCLG